jgi:2-polyprenyl-3-methyl-5-hydroxy-6-metoxy-1,4-benzoquinol methylase
MRGISTITGKGTILQYYFDNIKKTDSILDVGFGAGIYGGLLYDEGYRNIDGVDIYGEEIEEMGLDLIYKTIYIKDICEFEFDHYNLIIMGDVLEHIPLLKSKKLLKKLTSGKCDHLVVSVPYQYWQSGTGTNPYENHEQPNITRKYMEEHFP